MEHFLRYAVYFEWHLPVRFIGLRCSGSPCVCVHRLKAVFLDCTANLFKHRFLRVPIPATQYSELAGSCGRQRRGTALDTGGPILFFTAFIYLSKFFIVVSYIICSYSLIQFIYYWTFLFCQCRDLMFFPTHSCLLCSKQQCSIKTSFFLSPNI